MKTLSRQIRAISVFYRLLGPYKRAFWLMALAVLGLAVWDGAIYSALLPLLSSFIDPDASGASGGGYFGWIATQFDRIPADYRRHIGVIVMVALTVGRSIVQLGYVALSTGFRVKIIVHLRRRMFGNFMLSRLTFFDGRKSGDLIQSLSIEVGAVTGGTQAILQMMQSLTAAAVVVFLMASLSWELLMVLVGFAGLNSLLVVFVGKRVKRLSEEGVRRRSDVMVAMHEGLAGVRKIKAFNLGAEVTERFRGLTTMAERVARRGDLLASALGPMTQALGMVALGAIVLLALVLDIFPAGGAGSAALFLFLVLVTRLVPTVGGINGGLTGLQNYLPPATKVAGLLEPHHAQFEESGTVTKQPLLEHEIVFDGVRMDYPTKSGILRDIQLRAPRGHTVAIVGDSGAGKTSLVSLIPRMYEPSGGAILIDGVNIRDFDLEHLRDAIGIVSQDIFLFNTTVKENIVMGRPEATDAEVRKAAEAAYAHDFIMDLPQGYDTVIGERGVKLSGGQQQRVSIAQTFLRDPEILILDEATNALDSESEAYIQRSFDELMKDRTTFVIAHRLNTVRNADMIIVLRQGRIVETGDWNSLTRAGGEFTRMVEMQTLQPTAAA